MEKHKAKIAEIIRVNQAGEYGAKRIYEGQLAALKNDHEAISLITHMYVQEIEHLKYFNATMSQNRVRPTAMIPIWHIAAYALGFISGKLGKEASMACTAAVENVIDQHYQEQLRYLSDQHEQHEELSINIAKFREEEIEHKNIGLQNTSFTPQYQLFQSVISFITKIAIDISKKI